MRYIREHKKASIIVLCVLMLFVFGYMGHKRKRGRGCIGCPDAPYCAKRFTEELFISSEFFLDYYDYAKKEFESCYNCISYISDLADHYGDREFGAELRVRFNSMLGIEEEE